ncbi:orexin receptor type 2 [Biomphalaria glabrata]|nr:orexin receptor type 2 [Biomphalaria glabrata]
MASGANRSNLDPATWNITLLMELNDAMFERLAPAIAFFVVLMLVGVVGNLVVCYIFIKKLRKSTQNFLLLCLGVFDLLSTVVGVPSEIYDMRHYYLYDSSPWACKWMRFLTTLPSIASILVLMVIAVDRYRKVCRPLHFQIRVSWVRKGIVVILIVSLVFSLPALYIYGLRTFETPIKNVYGHDCSVADFFMDKSYPIIYEGILAFLFAFFTFVLVVLYIRIWTETRRHRAYMRTHASMGAVRMDDSFYTSSTNYDSSSDNIADNVSNSSRRASGSSVHKKSFLRGHIGRPRTRSRNRTGIYKQADQPRSPVEGQVEPDFHKSLLRTDVDGSVGDDLDSATCDNGPYMKQNFGRGLRQNGLINPTRRGSTKTQKETELCDQNPSFKSTSEDQAAADVTLTPIKEGVSLDSQPVSRRRRSKSRANSREPEEPTNASTSNRRSSSDQPKRKDYSETGVGQDGNSCFTGSNYQPETNSNDTRLAEHTKQSRGSQIERNSFAEDTCNTDIVSDDLHKAQKVKSQDSLRPNRVSFYKYLQQMNGSIDNEEEDESRHSMLGGDPVIPYRQRDNSIRPNGSVASFISLSQEMPLKSDQLKRLSKSTQSLTAKRVKKALRASRTTVIASVITLGFVLSYLPHLILVILRSALVDFEHHLNHAELLFYNIFVRSYFVNNVINIFVYGSMNLEFRTQILKIWALCRKRREKPEAPVSNLRRNTAASGNVDIPNGSAKESRC